MEKNKEATILNCPRLRKRGLSININGRITLRSSPCKLLDLKSGDSIFFVSYDGQTYIAKDIKATDGIKLYGRPGQLHGNSATTVKNLWTIIPYMPIIAKEVDLIVSNKVENLPIGDASCPALAFISRVDKEHCR